MGRKAHIFCLTAKYLMVRIIIAFIACTLLTGEVAARQVYIRRDYGGKISEYDTRLDLYKRRNDNIVIDGTCMSACVRFMGVKNACATKLGYFYFHGVTGENGSLLYNESVADSRQYDLPKALALEEKYDAFGFHRTETPGPSEQLVEDGVSIVYQPMSTNPSTYMKFLKVRANLIIPQCK